MSSGLAELAHSRELLVNLTLRDIRGRYKRTLLGNAWSLVNPLALMLIYTLVFGLFLRVQPDKGDPSGLDVFALWLLCGLLPWTFLSTSLNAASLSFLSNANLVQKVYLPRASLVISSVLAVAFTFVIEMTVLAVVIAVLDVDVLVWLPLTAVAMALMAVFVLGLALVVAVGNVYFRDVQHFLVILLQLWFYLTPIIYPLSYVQTQEDRLAANGHDVPIVTLMKLNPLEHFAEVFRNLLYDNRLPGLGDSLFCLVSALVALGLGAYVFARLEGRLAEEL